MSELLFKKGNRLKEGAYTYRIDEIYIVRMKIVLVDAPSEYKDSIGNAQTVWIAPYHRMVKQGKVRVL